MNCPICNTPLKLEFMSKCAYGVEESLEVCPNCGMYSEHYNYGYMIVDVGKFTVSFGPESMELSTKMGLEALCEIYRGVYHRVKG